MHLTQLMVICSLAVASCGSSRESAANDKMTDSATKENTMTAPNQDNKYRLIVSFISIGEGTDPDARKVMDGVLENWNKKLVKPLQWRLFPGEEKEKLTSVSV
jgi:hypothetical protein